MELPSVSSVNMNGIGNDGNTNTSTNSDHSSSLKSDKSHQNKRVNDGKYFILF